MIMLKVDTKKLAQALGITEAEAIRLGRDGRFVHQCVRAMLDSRGYAEAPIRIVTDRGLTLAKSSHVGTKRKYDAEEHAQWLSSIRGIIVADATGWPIIAAAFLDSRRNRDLLLAIADTRMVLSQARAFMRDFKFGSRTQ